MKVNENPYSFSEIEKIQQEIERDLDFNDKPQNFESLEETSLSITQPVQPVETYVREPKPLANQKPFGRQLVFLLIVCTLGMGMLGLGIGAAIAFLSSDNVELPIIADTDEATVWAISGNQFVFEGLENFEDGVQAGTLADVVSLVDPAVVRIVLERSGHPLDIPFPVGTVGNVNGSGIIFNIDTEMLYIVTNNHVIAGADAVNISIMDSQPIPANLVGRNTNYDLAVLSLNVADVRNLGIDNISIAVFGDSDAMRVGDVVLAIGNAMGEGNSATSGIISATDREIFYRNASVRMFQTDAAINPGTSGGPLINSQGYVIGINTTINPGEHHALEGMGFSVPSNTAKYVIEEIMNRTPRPFLGISGRTVDEDIAAVYDVPPIGIYVSSVIEDSAAARAGMQAHDIITSFNGRAIFNFTQLEYELSLLSIGDTVDVMIIRGGREHLVLQVTLGVESPNNF